MYPQPKPNPKLKPKPLRQEASHEAFAAADENPKPKRPRNDEAVFALSAELEASVIRKPHAQEALAEPGSDAQNSKPKAGSQEVGVKCVVPLQRSIHACVERPARGSPRRLRQVSSRSP